MAGKIEWLQYNGKEILFNDRSGLRDDSIIKNSDIAVKTVLDSGKKDILYLVDNSNTILVPHVKDHIKKGANEIKPYIKKLAVVGPNAAQKVLLNVLSALTGMNIKVFADMESAQEWLVK
ncbi:MAG: STAS/SEC14 domain-containing protein [Bacteroidales bacterium]|nr:STAS/SEC14 domain-containing protein [Bacteroidales bacterium]